MKIEEHGKLVVCTQTVLTHFIYLCIYVLMYIFIYVFNVYGCLCFAFISVHSSCGCEKVPDHLELE